MRKRFNENVIDFLIVDYMNTETIHPGYLILEKQNIFKVFNLKSNLLYKTLYITPKISFNSQLSTQFSFQLK